ncbi:MAG: imidazole glycerol phosphate synthase subunit HisH [Paludibacteraceae bacterium]|nr:imidazole glycerol phosphate synthase subunit HisH [Paludibacteraceae bacterium]MBN2787100.1 imidazole glycerol phosphate synthase subunit HisH [Paludibacteraceae bacterium]
MNIVIIKYNAGNIRSVLFALERLGMKAVVSDDPDVIRTADKVIFPGVGEAASAMAYLREKELDKLIVSLKQPVLGICLGLQLMCKHTEEGNTDCLGIFEQQVKLFPPTEKVPQIGWNNIFNLKTTIFDHVSENAYLYFVHSYYAEIGENTIATANYITPYSAALHKNNFYAMQYHPEKSGDVGEQMLRNFIHL